jgi:L-amino acid N-acyltransferase
MSAMSDLTIRLATAADLADINAIYNHYVLHSTCTYQTEPETGESRAAWFAGHGPAHPITVAENAGRIVGWGSLSRFHARAAYGRTVENSVYVDPALHRHGIGRAILTDLIGRARRLGHHTIIGGIDAEQSPSIALHAALGFQQVAFLREVGYKFDRWLHVIYMQLVL